MKATINCVWMLFLLSFCGKPQEHAHPQEAKVEYTCPMDPQIIRDKPGHCPICGMRLVKRNASNQADGTIQLTSHQIKLANITTAAVQLEVMGETTVLTGKLVVAEDQVELVSSRTKGRIEKLTVRETGVNITQGQVLYELYSEELLTWQEEYLMTLRQVKELKGKQYGEFLAASRKKLLLGGMTARQLDELAAQGKPNSRIPVQSPVSGLVAAVNVTEGQYVDEGTVLYRIEKLDRLWAELELYPTEVSYVSVGDVVKVTVSGLEDQPVEGKITLISPAYRAGSQITTARAVIANPGGRMIPGTQITVVLSHSGRKTLALPIDAVIRDARGASVWIADKTGGFHSRMVTTGLENDEMIEITSGLSEKEEVVVTGAYMITGEQVLKHGGDAMAGHHHEK